MFSTNEMIKKLSLENPCFYELTKTDVKDTQVRLLEIVDDIDKICRENNINYTISGGNAIGALRHKGFIPWDDDFDICIPRKDYDRLVKILKEQTLNKYWLQNIKFSEKYDLNFTKVRLKDSKFEEVLEPDISKAGIFVDIFPMENTYDNAIKRRIHGEIGNLLLLICSCVRFKNKSKRIVSFFKGNKKLLINVKIKSVIGFIFAFLPDRKWFVITEKWLSKCKNENSKYISIPTGRGHFFGELYLRNKLFPFIEKEYEEKEYYIMNQTDYYLKKLYGDYMKIPDESEREKHCIVDYKLKI